VNRASRAPACWISSLGFEVSPLAFTGADYVSVRLSAEAATDNPSAFIFKRDFAGVVLAAPTIYLRLPLYCAHWTILHGWTEPHFYSSNGLMPPRRYARLCATRREGVAGMRMVIQNLLYFFFGRKSRDSRADNTMAYQKRSGRTAVWLLDN